jgi:hypothetical protein
MARTETLGKIRDELAADQARYDEVTRRLRERIERGRESERERRGDQPRESS